MKANTKFNFDVKDITMIESALFLLQTNFVDDSDKKEVINLLAKIHHQKVWYRPKNRVYTSG